MHRARPLPDELLAGVIGRLCVINGCTGESNLITGLRHAHGLPESTPTLHVLAEHFGSSPDEIAFRHTLLPIQRAISAHVGTKREKSIVASHVASSNISFRPKVEARSCIECATVDAVAGRPSYWRRVHNMQTVDWCLEHQIPLVRLPLSAFELLPLDAIRMHATEPCATTSMIGPGSALGRYAELLKRWLDRSSTFSSIALNKVIQDASRKRGLRFSQTGKRPLVSDLAREVLPTDWMERYWPDIAGKTQGAYVGRFDGPCKDKHVAYPGPTCALVLAVLFSSADEIEARLNAANDEVMKAFFRDDDTSVRRARQAFLDGASLETIYLEHAISADSFETWLRKAARLLTKE